MAKPTYWELLQHPKWQEKRLRMLSLNAFSCSDCGSTEKTLHVHHSYYEKGLAPWEYPDESLHVLCVDCHKKAQDQMVAMQRQIGRIELGDLDRLYGYALGVEAQNFPHAVIDVGSYEQAWGIADAWGLRAEDVIGSLTESSIDGYRLTELKARRRS